MGKGEGNGEGWGAGEGYGEGSGGQWRSGLFDSCGITPKCCIGFLIPPFGNYFAAEKIDGVGDCAKYVGCLDFLGGVLVCSMLGQCLIRQKIRERENIDGSAIGDMFASLCCLECSICQTVHHVDSD